MAMAPVCLPEVEHLGRAQLPAETEVISATHTNPRWRRSCTIPAHVHKKVRWSRCFNTCFSKTLRAAWSPRDVAQHQDIRLAGSSLPLHQWDLPHSLEAFKQTN